MYKLTVTRGDKANTTVLPEFMLDHLNLKEGDTITIIPTANGYLLTSNSEEVEEQIKLGLEFMSDYNETFQELAE